MGSRPSSYLGYGIAWDEGESTDEEIESFYELCWEISEHPEVSAEMWAHEETPCLFIYIGETYHQNDWDGVGVVDMKKLKGSDTLVNYNKFLKEICDKYKLNYKKPQYHLLSYYG